MLTSSKIRSTLLFLLFFSNSFISFAENPVRSKHGMVVTANDLATEVGVQILKKGGNAIDASVAIGFALAVSYPSAGNIGGGGFMVIHLDDGKNTTIDFRETAPLAAHEKMFLDSLGNFIPALSQDGWTSSGVPGTVAGLIYALEKYGTMKLKDVIQPAIDLAEKGFALSYKNSETSGSSFVELSKIESTKKIFTKDGKKLEEGDLLIQKDLANTLRLIRDGERVAFYEGEIAKKFVEESRRHGGLFTLNDLKDYRAIERKPIEGTYRGYKIISMPPPSSGGICLIEALNALENFSFKKEEWGSSRYIHTLVEVMKRIYADRAEHMGDADFYPVPVEELISKSYGKQIHNEITEEATPSEKIKALILHQLREHEETTHYSVADQFGNAVATTYTLNGGYGNRIVVEGLGFLLNNEMDDFSSKPGVPNQYGLVGSVANSIQPKKRMLSSMTPTIILKDDKPFMVIGTPGGSTIITSVLQTILNVLDFNMNIYDAIAAPKIHHQWLPDEIDFEKFSLSDDVQKNLLARGHKLGKEKSLGRMEGIILDHRTNTFYGATDPRGYGKAEGW
ncbi:MAG: gamma-glutamyltransferase [Ignavibacteriales bacterium]|nr:MAG: gamma-glutamyltransferase [Ignavibacteriales bacterium]